MQKGRPSPPPEAPKPAAEETVKMGPGAPIAKSYPGIDDAKKQMDASKKPSAKETPEK